MKARVLPHGEGRFYITDIQQTEGSFRGVGRGDIVKYRGKQHKIVRADSCYNGKLIYSVDTVPLYKHEQQ